MCGIVVNRTVPETEVAKTTLRIASTVCGLTAKYFAVHSRVPWKTNATVATDLVHTLCTILTRIVGTAVVNLHGAVLTCKVPNTRALVGLCCVHAGPTIGTRGEELTEARQDVVCTVDSTIAKRTVASVGVDSVYTSSFVLTWIGTAFIDVGTTVISRESSNTITSSL
jgi:hypothetical protein